MTYHDVVRPSWDIPVAVGLTVAAAFIQCMVPAKDISGMVQDLLPPMMGITATLIAFVFAGLAFFVSFNGDDDDPNAYSGLLFLFQRNAAAGIATVIAGLFVYLMSCDVCWPYLIFLFMFFYTLLSIVTLFGSIAKYGIYKYDDQDV